MPRHTGLESLQVEELIAVVERGEDPVAHELLTRLLWAATESATEREWQAQRLKDAEDRICELAQILAKSRDRHNELGNQLRIQQAQHETEVRELRAEMARQEADRPATW